MQESAKGITQETGRSRRQRAGRELEKAELKAREKPNLIQADFLKELSLFAALNQSVAGGEDG